MPIEEDIHKAYHEYYTHHQGTKKSISLSRRFRHSLDNSYLSRRYGYHIVPERRAKFFGLVRCLSLEKRAALDFSVMYLSAQADGRLLEVGCGSGDMLKIMQELGWQVEGVDFDPLAVENAKSKGLRVFHGTLEAQAYPDDHFDAVTMSHIIEHVHDPEQLLCECYRILKPGGRLVLVTPNSDSWGHRKFAVTWLHLDPPRHLHVFNPRSLTDLAQKAGFRIERSLTSIRDTKFLFIASRAIKHTGKYVWGSPQPWGVRRWGKVMMLFEWVMLRIFPHAGEEIVLIIKK